MWIKAFGVDHVATRKTIQKQFGINMKSFSKQVLRSHHKQKSRREVLREWRKDPENNQLLNILKFNSNADGFEADEKEFYYAQNLF